MIKVLSIWVYLVFPFWAGFLIPISANADECPAFDLGLIGSENWNWAWMELGDKPDAVYGVKGEEADINTPGSMSDALGWKSSDNCLWMFGGNRSLTRANNVYQGTNDLWRYNPQTDRWTWIWGISSVDEIQYGDQGKEDKENAPGYRTGSSAWTGINGEFWMFGGYGTAASNSNFPGSFTNGYLNDLWRYNPMNQTWTWIKGSKTAEGAGVYGTQGIPNAINTPGARSGGVTWTDLNGNLWLFGGSNARTFSSGGVTTTTGGWMNDLWQFDQSTNNWTWIKGSQQSGQSSVFGTEGSFETDNTPGAINGGEAWTSNGDNLWLLADGNLWRFDINSRNWAWVKGRGSDGHAGIYGELKTPDSNNRPGTRNYATEWVSGDGNLWLYGGYGYDSTGTSGTLNDVWKFNISDGNWAWMGGTETITTQSAVYGIKGVEAGDNTPGVRQSCVGWNDGSGNLLLYSGTKKSGEGYPGDLWKYNSTSENWVWIGGTDQAQKPALYGERGLENPANRPGERRGAVSWTGSDGNFWLFGNRNSDASGDLKNDLWKYSEISGDWTWVKGNSVAGEHGRYGERNLEGANSTPGGRGGASSWTAADGSLWLFGGFGYADSRVTSSAGHLNDMWRFNPQTKNWTWMGGSNGHSQRGIYGTQGIESPDNLPGARFGAATWNTNDGYLWLFGGSGLPLSGITVGMNDLWRYNLATGAWTWMKGSNSFTASAQYGTQGVAASNNTPGGRRDCITWVGSDGRLWLFGGVHSTGSYDDLWRYDPVTGNWTWMKGGNPFFSTQIRYGVYGSKGIANSTNVPGSRCRGVGWIGNDGNFWMFGGTLVRSAPSAINYYETADGSYHDLWKYDPETNNWAWMDGTEYLYDGAQSTGAPPIKYVFMSIFRGEESVASHDQYPMAANSGYLGWKGRDGALWLFGDGVWKYGPGIYIEVEANQPTLIHVPTVSGHNEFSISITSNAIHGHAALSETTTSILYTPNPGFVGDDRFQVGIVGNGACEEAPTTVYIKVKTPSSSRVEEYELY